jgi:hypothetical protein
VSDPNIPSGNLVFLHLAVAVVVAAAVVLLLQYVSKALIRDDYDLPSIAFLQR